MPQAQPKRAERACPICAEAFTPRQANQLACSRSCRDKMPDRRARARRYTALPHVREAKNAPRRVSANPERTAVNLAALLRQRYRMTLNEFQQMLRTQRGLCAICKSLPAADGKGPMGRLHVDHDHVTGRVRALLCASCNNGLGRFKDDPQLLREAAAYIESHAVQ